MQCLFHIGKHRLTEVQKENDNKTSKNSKMLKSRVVKWISMLCKAIIDVECLFHSGKYELTEIGKENENKIR